ncbi:MAG: two-component regulator propeller domain-containing protein [Mariniphaga sp.]
MSNHLYSRRTLLVGSLLIAAMVFPGAFTSSENGKPNSNSIPCERIVSLPDLPADPIKNAIFTDTGISIKTFRSVVVDNDNIKWFVTEQGIVSFDGKKWTLHNYNKKIASQDLKDVAYEFNSKGPQLWLASNKGATVTNLPFNADTDVTTYLIGNTPILSDSVKRVVVGKSPMRWFGTAKGVSAQKDDKWLKPDYDDYYPVELFMDYAITSMATNPGGDSLYVGTEGAGVARMMRNDVDGISGASVYAQWGPILLPSDKIYSVFIENNGTKWFGTDKGISRHTGNNTLKNWKTFTKKDGLIDNFVQSIAADATGKIWIGTKSGVSVYNGTVWTSFTKDNGLNSNNILCITIDRTGVVWIGTDEGVNSYEKGNFISYK